ncbi:MAG: hypothetical protein IJZ06_08335 [Bacteroidales bacterium]|nr:hypothetical protein [Bacteroidales bacterium]
MKKCLKIALLSLLLVSCSKQDTASRMLSMAQSYVETSPDTALIYLDSILIPEKFLKEERYMEYLVTKVQAKYKNYDNIKDDTNIFEAKHYFNKKAKRPTLNAQSSEYRMYANLYSGCVYEEMEEFEKALSDYKTAFTIAEATKDSLYMWRINNYIGNIFNKKTYWEEALKTYKKSLVLAKTEFEKAGSYAKLAIHYYLNDNKDSSLFHIDKAINMAELSQDEKTQSQVYQNAYVIYSELGETKLAWKYLNMSASINNDISKESLYNLNFLSFYLAQDMEDSARIYVNKLRNNFETIDDNHLKSSICDAFTSYYSAKGIHDSALYYQKEMTSILDAINKENLEQNIYEIQKKYDYELQRNVYQSKLNKRLVAIIIILCAAIVLYIIVKQRERWLSNQVRNLSLQNEDYKRGMKESLKVIKKVNESEHDKRKKQNINEIKEHVYGSQYKTAFEASVDVLETTYSKISLFVKKAYPQLNQTEYKVCLLSIMQTNIEETAKIVGLGIDSVKKARSNIRKKLGIEKRLRISEFILMEYYAKKKVAKSPSHQVTELFGSHLLGDSET